MRIALALPAIVLYACRSISLSGPADASRPLLKVSSTHTSPSEFAVYDGLLRITHVLALCCYEFFVSVVTVRDCDRRSSRDNDLILRLYVVYQCGYYCDHLQIINLPIAGARTRFVRLAVEKFPPVRISLAVAQRLAFACALGAHSANRTLVTGQRATRHTLSFPTTTLPALASQRRSHVVSSPSHRS